MEALSNADPILVQMLEAIITGNVDGSSLGCHRRLDQAHEAIKTGNVAGRPKPKPPSKLKPPTNSKPMTTSIQSNPDGEDLDIDRKLLAHHEERITQLLALLAKAPKSGNKRLILEASLTAAEASRTDILKAIRAKEERTGNLADRLAIEPLFEPPDIDDPEWQAAMDSLGGKSREVEAGPSEHSERVTAQETRDRANPAHDAGAAQRQAAARHVSEAKATEHKALAERQAEARDAAARISDANINAMLTRWWQATGGCIRTLLARHGDPYGHLSALGAPQRQALLDEITRDLESTPPPKPKPRPRPIAYAVPMVEYPDDPPLAD